MRRSPMKRSCTPLRRIGATRKKQRALYLSKRAEWLRIHPVCQGTIFALKLNEADVMAYAVPVNGGVAAEKDGQTHFIPYATDVHHRCKCNGSRLTDTRWFLSVCREMHEQIEGNKVWARRLGLLLDISADINGRTPAGEQGLTTDELMKLRR